MIHGNLLPKEIETLYACSVQLYLTGSRYFNSHKAISDYDFFCADTKANKAELASLFKWSVESRDDMDSVTYSDSNTAEVWFHLGSIKIHVQFVKDVEWKLRAQNHLEGFPFGFVEKKYHKLIWNWANSSTR